LLVGTELILASVIIHVYVNDDAYVSVWQDVSMENQPEERVIEDVDTLKAMADPTRLAILAALTKSQYLPVMSVKELAAELAEPQTKLYRHVKQLEAAGLIRVAATRMVSGILEQRYQACQFSVRLGPALVRQHPAEISEAVRVAFDRFLDDFVRVTQRDPEPPDALRSAMQAGDFDLSAEAAAELRRRMTQLWEWLDQQPEEPDGVKIHLLTGFYTERPDLA
jgi:DNA-binding transcriptional ArsR family regulator